MNIQYTLNPNTANGKRVASALYDRIDDLTDMQTEAILQIVKVKDLISLSNIIEHNERVDNIAYQNYEILPTFHGKADQS